MNMREKLARALLAWEYGHDVGGEMEDFWWDRHGERYLDMADAALDALMEPTAGMLMDGAVEYVKHSDAGRAFISMIRAAKEGK